MRIRVNVLDRDSINDAIAQINGYKKSLNSKIESILTELTAMGQRIVETQYSIGQIVNGIGEFETRPEYEMFEVYCEVGGNNAMIIAEGENVVFLEFGTGVATTDTTAEMETEGLPPIYEGSWSETEGTGVFARHGYWHYNGVLYMGTVATQGFYFASKEIKQRAVEVAKRVFKQ